MDYLNLILFQIATPISTADDTSAIQLLLTDNNNPWYQSEGIGLLGAAIVAAIVSGITSTWSERKRLEQTRLQGLNALDLLKEQYNLQLAQHKEQWKQGRSDWAFQQFWNRQADAYASVLDLITKVDFHTSVTKSMLELGKYSREQGYKTIVEASKYANQLHEITSNGLYLTSYTIEILESFQNEIGRVFDVRRRDLDPEAIADDIKEWAIELGELHDKAYALKPKIRIEAQRSLQLTEDPDESTQPS